MSSADEERKNSREERMRKSRETARAALEAVRTARIGFLAAGGAAVVAKELRPDPKASIFRQSTLHKALRPFTQLGNTDECDAEPQ